MLQKLLISVVFSRSYCLATRPTNIKLHMSAQDSICPTIWPWKITKLPLNYHHTLAESIQTRLNGMAVIMPSVRDQVTQIKSISSETYDSEK